MNQLQLSIISLIALVVILIVIYHLYQERRFKKIITNNFNQQINDGLIEDKALILEANDLNQTSYANSFTDLEEAPTSLYQTEINLELVAELDKKETLFKDFDSVNFDQLQLIDLSVDYIIDIAFEKIIKIKLLPDLNPLTNKKYAYYVLDKAKQWQLYQKGTKYYALGIKLVINLVDAGGVISDLQLSNICQELIRFRDYHQGVLRADDYELKLRKLQQQVKFSKNLDLDLELYLINKEEIKFKTLAKYFGSQGLEFKAGYLIYTQDNQEWFKIGLESGSSFDESKAYSLLMVSAKLHHHKEPIVIINKIFDIMENYTNYFEARLLTTNRLLLGEKDYQSLIKQVKVHIDTSNRQGIELGSTILKRLYP